MKKKKTSILWAKNPIIYEINTWVWLNALSRRYGSKITLGTVPTKEWKSIADLGIHGVWFMGVWERSPVGLGIARDHKELQKEYKKALPDFSQGDVVGSPYAVHRYVVDENLGGPDGLADAREILSGLGIRVLLDFVPNHVARDHPWVMNHSEYFIQGNNADLTERPGEFFEAEAHILAHGKDPYFPPWTDTVQIHAFHKEVCKAVKETLNDIAGQCDGVRCDMAMLMMNGVFLKTWGKYAGNPPKQEFWDQTIKEVKKKNPGFLFIAEAYWNMEWNLQQEGFDYCYDKRLFDRLVHKDAGNITDHLQADTAYQKKLIRFIENHDEPRSASNFEEPKLRSSALIFATLPGAKLFHEGQLEGWKMKLPVQLGRRLSEKPNVDLNDFYMILLKTINNPAFRDGEWSMCEKNSWPDNKSCKNLVSWCWSKGDNRFLIVVNFSNFGSQGKIRIPWKNLKSREWVLHDLFTKEEYTRKGDAMCDQGLYVDLKAWGFHLLKISPI